MLDQCSADNHRGDHHSTPHTTLGSLSFAREPRQPKRKHPKRRWAAIPTRLNARIVDAGLPPEVAGLVAVCGSCDACDTGNVTAARACLEKILIYDRISVSRGEQHRV